MDSIIETQRAVHEELERYEQALAEVLMQTPSVQRNIARRDRKAAEILDRIVQLRQTLVNQYEDIPGLRPKEIALLSAPAAGEDDLAEFYNRFEGVKDFHRRHQGINARQFLNEIDEMVRSDGYQTMQIDDNGQETVIDPLDAVFSGEEGYGRYLDLYLAHTMYLNLRGANRLSYLAYLDMLKHGKVERTLDLKEKSDPAYLQYVQNLYTYLLSFFERALPLIDIQTKIKEEEENFATAWDAGQVPGWEVASSSKSKAMPGNGEGIWCQYCQKTYSKQTVYDAHLKSEKHKKKEAAGQTSLSTDAPSTSGPSTAQTNRQKLRQPALLTYLISSLLTHQPIPTLIQDSRNEVERRMALTSREREAELEEAEEAPVVVVDPGKDAGVEDDDEDDEDGKLYNPLKLPMGWDGKPIPYWLFKLHGLGVEFRCEICSDFVYMGRKAFDRHFQESRHAFGMRALGLPNTKHFHEITKITDALSLAEKLKHEGRQEMSLMEKAEEFEDADGNVYDKKTYEDLKRQGLL